MADLAFAEVDVKVRFCRRGAARRLPCRILKCALAPVAWLASPVKSEDPFMIATAPVAARSETSRTSLSYLLLGDLRSLLEEPAGTQRDRWLVATLDMLFMSRPRSGPAIYLPTLAEGPGRSRTTGRFSASDLVPFDKLQRLRDRIVHRAPSGVLVQELKDDLGEWAETMKRLALMATPACDE